MKLLWSDIVERWLSDPSYDDASYPQIEDVLRGDARPEDLLTPPDLEQLKKGKGCK